MSVAEACAWGALFVGMALGCAKKKRSIVLPALAPLVEAPLSPEEIAERRAGLPQQMQRHFEAQRSMMLTNPAQAYLSQFGLGGPLIPPR